MILSTRGFSLVEALVAVAIAAGVTAAVFALASPADSAFAVQSEGADVQQRVRAGIDALGRDLLQAGAGVSLGGLAVPLNRYFAPVVPARVASDPAGRLRTDALTVTYVPAESARAVLGAAMPARSSQAMLQVSVPGCPRVGALCGFEVGMRVLIFDETGAQDLFSVLEVNPPFLVLRHDTPDSPHVYRPGSPVVEVVSRAYFLRIDPATGEPQLARADSHAGETPVVDHVTRVSFALLGDPEPPQLAAGPDDPRGPWTSYGMRPPAEDMPAGTHPAGENCIFSFDGLHRARLPPLEGTPLVELEAERLTDGPWCPDAVHPRRFDADLLRVRSIRVSIRVQSAIAALRGPAGTLFSRGGTSRSALRRVPDLEARFEVTPPNLEAERR